MSGDRLVLEINRDYLRDNLENVIAKKFPLEDIIAVVKANAYGLGLDIMGKLFVELGIRRFATAYLEEALELKEFARDIYILAGISQKEMTTAIENDFIISLNSIENVREVHSVAKKLGLVARVSIVLDSGMGRVGFLASHLEEHLEEIFSLTHLNVIGIYSHFARLNPIDRDFSLQQIQEMKNIKNIISEKNFNVQEFHIARSYCLAHVSESLEEPFNLVRLGVALYAFDYQLNQLLGLKPIVKLSAQVLSVRVMPKGWNIGYDEYLLNEEACLATLSIGYADLLIGQWSKNNTSYVLFNGQRCPIIHTSMDYTIVRIPKDLEVRVGDYMVVLGEDGDDELTVSQLSNAQSIVNYNILCSLGKRCKRIVINNDKK